MGRYAAVFQSPAPLAAEDLAGLAFVNEAVISPTADRVAYAVRRMDLQADRYRAAIFVSAVDGSGAARWTDGTADDATPRWSPDGQRLAFVSDRGAVPAGKKRAPKNVFIVDGTGGEPRQIATFADDCGDLTWLPDGSGVIVTLKDAGTGQPDDAPKVYDRIRYKSDDAGLFDLRRKHLWLVPLQGDPRKLTDGDWDDTQPSVSPDGTQVAFTSNRSVDRDRNTVSDIWTMPIAGGSPVRVTTERGQYTNASWSPDGACDHVPRHGRRGRRGRAQHPRLALPARRRGRHRSARRLGSDDRLARDERHPRRDRGAAASVDPRRPHPLHRLGPGHREPVLRAGDQDGGDVRAETLGAHQLVSATVDREARCFAGVLATATSPGEVVTGQPGHGLKPITTLNSALLSGRYIAEPERVEFTGADGWTIEGWLLKPRDFDPAKRWPLVLEIHGGPHGAYGHSFFHEFQVLAGRGYAVLYTNPRGSHAYGDTFVRACVGDWGGKDYEDLMAGVDHALGLGWVDRERLYVTGGSYGGFMTNWIVGHTDRFRAAVTQRSISNNISAFGTSDIGWHFWQFEMGDATPWRDAHKLVERSPLTYVTNVKTPLLILHAEKDFRCPIEQAEQFFVALKVLGKEAVFVRFQDDTHELTRGGKPRNRIDHARRIADWFDAHP